MAAAAAWPFSMLRTASTTFAPAPASAEGAARPMPLLAPVTMTVRPVMSGTWALLEVVMDNNVGAAGAYRLRMASTSLRGPPVEHLSVAERVAAGQAARGRGAARSGGASRTAGQHPRGRSRADPLRAHARLPVRVLPGRGADHGQRSGWH